MFSYRFLLKIEIFWFDIKRTWVNWCHLSNIFCLKFTDYKIRTYFSMVIENSLKIYLNIYSPLLTKITPKLCVWSKINKFSSQKCIFWSVSTLNLHLISYWLYPCPLGRLNSCSLFEDLKLITLLYLWLDAVAE